MVSGRGWYQPTLKKRKRNQHDHQKCHQNPLGQLLKQFSNSISSGNLSSDHYWRDGIQEIHNFRGFWELSWPLIFIFLHDILFVAKSYLVVVINIKFFIMSALVTLETRLKALILTVFCNLGHFFSSLF